MHSRNHVSTAWILLALLLGLTLFVVFVLDTGALDTATRNSLSLNQFAQSSTEHTTPLHTRKQALTTDTHCLNELEINTQTANEDWERIRAFLEEVVPNNTGSCELRLRTLASEEPEKTITSLCAADNVFYVLRKGGDSEEFVRHEFSAFTKEEQLFATEFILPRTHTTSMYTNLFPDNAVGIGAFAEESQKEIWSYFKYAPTTQAFEQIEWCTNNNQELNCNYTYSL